MIPMALNLEAREVIQMIELEEEITHRYVKRHDLMDALYVVKNRCEEQKRRRWEQIGRQGPECKDLGPKQKAFT